MVPDPTTVPHLLLVNDRELREWRSLEVGIRVVKQHDIIVGHEHLPVKGITDPVRTSLEGWSDHTDPARGAPKTEGPKGVLTLYPSRTALAMVRYLHGRSLVSVAWNQLMYGGRVLL